LQNAEPRFKSQGLGIAAMTYDNVETLRDFANRMKITFPLLSDSESATIRAFRMLDPDNTEGNVPKYGAKNVAYPGWFVIDPKGVIRDRFIDGNWNDRFSANSVVARLFPELMEIRGERREAPHLTAEALQSDRVASPGSRLTLAVEVTLPKGVHVYAPGAAGYKSVELELTPGIEFTTRPVAYPPSKVMHLEAINERVPVFENRFRVTQDVVISDRSAFQRTLPADREQSKTIMIQGVFRYQACDDRTCFRPAELPLAWKIEVHRNDSKRPAKENQKPVTQD
jgi:hypothetical protein